MSAPSTEALAALDAKVRRAFETGDERELTVLGYGEISTVVALRCDEGDFACKRMPPFGHPERLGRYRERFETYLSALRASGIRPLESTLTTVEAEAGAGGVWCIQPLLPKEQLMVRYLAAADLPSAVAALNAVLDRVLAFVGPTQGLDGQLSNWVWVDDAPAYLDVTTPLLRDERGRDLLDVELFLSAIPWLLRGLVRRFLLGEILDKYFTPRGVVLDLLGNLFKEGLEHLLPAFLAEANRRLTPAFTADEVWRYYEGDAKTWALLLGLRRLDRRWQRTVRRRPYPFLLPGRIERNLRRPQLPAA